MSEEKKEISIVTERSPNAQTIAATGVWGGASPDLNAVIAHFYVEYQSTPNIITITPDEHGAIDINSGTRTARGDVTRVIQGSIVLSPELAESLSRWLIEKVDFIKENRKPKG